LQTSYDVTSWNKDVVNQCLESGTHIRVLQVIIIFIIIIIIIIIISNQCSECRSGEATGTCRWLRACSQPSLTNLDIFNTKPTKRVIVFVLVFSSKIRDFMFLYLSLHPSGGQNVV